jgi:hypothetical protein
VLVPNWIFARQNFPVVELFVFPGPQFVVQFILPSLINFSLVGKSFIFPMNLQPPIDQNSISIYSGNAPIIKARLEQFLNARPMLRKWTLPNYVRLSGFPEYEAQMKLIFHDAQIYDVVMGRALRTVPYPAEPVAVTNCRRIYDEANSQAYSLIVRTFTTANSGFVDRCEWLD